ncbi:MAG: HD domain-containing protein [Dehalococcoidales bacterium]|nr:HD domain-containing protein [Dehalococcoidales bacterium]
MKEIFEKIWEIAFPYQDKRDDTGHAEVTLRYAGKLLEVEGGDEDVVIPAIILHDVGWSQLPRERRMLIFDKDAAEDQKKGAVMEHQAESARLARTILRQVDYPEKLIDEIVEIVSQHDTRKGFISKNEGLVRDSDKLWRTSKEGFEAGKRKNRSPDPERMKKNEEMMKKPDYFYSETARKWAEADYKLRLEEKDNQSAD